MKCLYKLTLFQFSDQQENVRESTSNTSGKGNDFLLSKKEIERQILGVQNNTEYLYFTRKNVKQSVIITYSLFTYKR